MQHLPASPSPQKNGVRGEVVGHGCSGANGLCPVQSISNCILHLRQYGAHPSEALAQVYYNGTWGGVKPSDITTNLCQAVTFLGPNLGFLPSDVLIAIPRWAILISRIFIILD